MPTVAQLHGMLLEESLLHLLRFSGYQPVTERGDDPTLREGNAGLEVLGRGEHHQIDAIADFTVPQPFANPGRLLIEAKFKDSAVGIEIVRNAVGVLKDVSEYWVSSAAVGGRAAHLPRQQPRYHYQYAILASSGFTENAQRYAVAHDVYLIPFERAGFFQSVMTAIGACGLNDGEVDRRSSLEMGIELSELRRRIRASLARGNDLDLVDIGNANLSGTLAAALEEIRRIQYAVLAVALDRVPLVLMPAQNVNIHELPHVVQVRIYWDDHAWYLQRVHDNGEEENLFTFDVPKTLLSQYLDQHELSPRRALELKQRALAEIKALFVREGDVRLVRFVLDQEWLDNLRARLVRG